MLLKRLCLMVAAETLMFYCLTFLPVSTVITVLNLSPIFVLLIQAYDDKVLSGLFSSRFPGPTCC
jgi:drug/metabolite transporter (DMT)-like permease